MRFDLGPGLEEARAAALAEVDRIAARQVAALGGDTAAHRLKREEAERVALDRAPLPRLYPVLSAEAAAMGSTILSRASLVLGQADAWRAALAQIEARRVARKAMLREAGSHAELRALVRGFLP